MVCGSYLGRKTYIQIVEKDNRIYKLCANVSFSCQILRQKTLDKVYISGRIKYIME